MSVTESEVLAYARACLKDSPNLPPDVLREVLKARFLNGQDPLAAALAQGTTIGAVANPLDWLQGLKMIFEGLDRIFRSKEIEGIHEVIAGVLKIVSEDSTDGGE